MGSLKMVPPTMFLIVPLGDLHICLRLNSVTRASSGVMVAHSMPTLSLDSLSGIDRDLVISGVTVLHTQIEVVDVEVEMRVDELVLDKLPDDSGHLVTVKFGNRVSNLNFLSWCGFGHRIVLSL